MRVLNPFASAWAPPGVATPTEARLTTPTAKNPAEPPVLRTPSALSPAISLLSLSLGANQSPCRDHDDLDSVQGSSIGGDSDGNATTLCSDEISHLTPRDGRRSLDDALAIKDAVAKHVEALHDAQLEMEQDGPVLASQVAIPPAGVPYMKDYKPALKDFELLSVVGQGAFGKVFQVVHKQSKKIYALKVMRKERILLKEHSEYVKSERDVLSDLEHPYIVSLRFSFQTPSKLYLVLDFINGGHLFFNLYREGVFSEDVARLYCAEMVCALSYLHSKNIMHRDLKPENVLVDSTGHIKLTDFGLAKGNVEGANDRSNSFIGTMEYMAPEIIDSKGHDKSVDWWSTGILLFEMLCGIPPFRAKSRKALQLQILTGKPKFPKFLSNDSLSILKGLLTRDPQRRLGSGPTGALEIKKHPFFKTIDWAKLERREIESKFKPTVKCNLSVENFDKIWTDQKPEDSPACSPGAHSQSVFQGFSYVQPSYMLTMNEGMLLIPAITYITKG